MAAMLLPAETARAAARAPVSALRRGSAAARMRQGRDGTDRGDGRALASALASYSSAIWCKVLATAASVALAASRRHRTAWLLKYMASRSGTSGTFRLRRIKHDPGLPVPPIAVNREGRRGANRRAAGLALDARCDDFSRMLTQDSAGLAARGYSTGR